MNEEQILKLLIKKLIEEAVTLGGGSITGMQLPLGATPTGGPIKYAEPDASYSENKITKKTTRKKRKKKKSYVNKDPQYYLNKDPQYYLKNGPENSRKRNFK